MVVIVLLVVMVWMVVVAGGCERRYFEPKSMHCRVPHSEMLVSRGCGRHVLPPGSVMSLVPHSGAEPNHPILGETYCLSNMLASERHLLGPRDRPGPNPREGGRGKGKPFPEGEEGSWKKSPVNPLSTKGWWDW